MSKHDHGFRLDVAGRRVWFGPTVPGRRRTYRKKKAKDRRRRKLAKRQRRHMRIMEMVRRATKPRKRRADAVGRWTIILDGHTARLNELLRCPLRTRMKLKKRDRQWVGIACSQAGVSRAEGKRRVSIAVVLGPRQRAGDVDDPFTKSLLDALKHAGGIVDDARRWCELAPVAYERGPRPAMRITLEDVAEIREA